MGPKLCEFTIITLNKENLDYKLQAVPILRALGIIIKIDKLTPETQAINNSEHFKNSCC